MSRYYSYLNSATVILHQYDGELPLAVFLKKIFSGQKKYGSTDRRQISHLCYCYFRTGHAFGDLSVEEKILISLFLVSTEPHKVLEQVKPDWIPEIEKTVAEKLEFLGFGTQSADMFPFLDDLSEGIEKEAFVQSFFVQPDLFIRLRPGKEKKALQKLETAGLQHQIIGNDCVALLNATGLDQVLEQDEEVVVQDYNSQKLGGFFKFAPSKAGLKVWDCCAASGGKSILMYDINPKIDLTVSDIRESILINLDERFRRAGIRTSDRFIADLEQPATELSKKTYDLIIADVPCSGSGTWSRTPEQMFFFEKEEIETYAARQRKIVANTIPLLNTSGTYIYVTCSVFKHENEAMVEYISQHHSLTLEKMEVLRGYDKKADTMFVAVFRKGV